MSSFTEWLKQKNPEAFDTLSGFGNRPGSGASAIEGMYSGITDSVRIPAHIANMTGNVLGLRNDEEAYRAANQIDNTLQGIPFLNQAQQDVFRQSAEQYPNTNEVNNIIPSFVGGQTMLKGAKIVNAGKNLAVPILDRVSLAMSNISKQGLSELLDSYTNKSK